MRCQAANLINPSCHFSNKYVTKTSTCRLSVAQINFLHEQKAELCWVYIFEYKDLMMNAVFILPDSLYCKTEKGLAVLLQQKRTLSLHMRQVLVLVDGRHTARELINQFSHLQFGQALYDLLMDGYVKLIQDTAKIHSEPIGVSGGNLIVPPISPSPVSPEPIKQPSLPYAEIKQVMQESSARFLGVMAANMQSKINDADTPAKLKTAIAQWSLALRESRHGQAYAETYLLMVKSLAQLD